MQESLLKLARAAVEEHLADVVNVEEPESLYDGVYTLAFDALWDAGAGELLSQQLASKVAKEYSYMELNHG